jgi:hypothetical protein
LSSPDKTYQSEYVAEVVSVDDPERKYRVQVRVYDLFGDAPAGDLPWAIYKLPAGARPNDGLAMPVQKGDLVWVDFPFNGDTRRPRIVGSVHHMPGKEPAIPHDAWQGGGQLQHKRAPEQPVPETPGYHEDVVFRQHGVALQITKGGAFRVTQVASGTSVEVAVDGSIVLHSEKDIFVSAEGNCLVDIKKDYELRVGGNMKQTANGVGEVMSSQNLTVGSSAAALSMVAATSGTMKGPGGLSLRGNTDIEGRLDTTGDVTSGGTIMDAAGNSNHHSH